MKVDSWYTARACGQASIFSLQERILRTFTQYPDIKTQNSATITVLHRLLFGLALFSSSSSYPYNMIQVFDFHTKGKTLKLFNAALPIVACLLFLLATCKSKIIDLLFSNRFSRFIGKISYSGYAWHYPILLVYFMNISGYFSRYGKATTVISYYVLTFAIATASHIFIEKPFSKLYPSPEALKSFISRIQKRSQ